MQIEINKLSCTIANILTIITFTKSIEYKKYDN